MARKRCFISAKYGLDLSGLQRALEQNKIDWQWAQDLPAGASLTQSIWDAIKSADFVVGVLLEDPINSNVALEIGYALGCGVPVILLTDAALAIPFDLAPFRHIRTNLQDNKLLAFQIDLVLRSLSPTKRRKRPIVSQLPRPKEVATDKPAPKLFDSAFEQTIAESIISAGGRVTVPSVIGEQVADLLMWFPELDKELFNPAAIETTGTTSFQNLMKQQSLLCKYVLTSGFGCGLIIVSSVALIPDLSRVAPFPNVFLISLSEFKDKLRDRELASWIRQERNRLAHGAR